MNKEVIYLEPEDDITDILTKLQRAKQKLVALVPPKKATMLRSAVNMKLVARAAKECKKVVVIVTADPAILKLAMAAQIPVAKNLQSRPVIPTKESLAAARTNEQVIDEDLADSDEKSKTASEKEKNAAKTSSEGSKSSSAASKVEEAEVINIDEESLENGSKDGKKASKKAKKGSDDKESASKLVKYRKWIIAGTVAALALIVFGVWALIFAPAVKITVAMSTSASNFSEEVRFTTDQNAVSLDNNVLFAEKQTLEQEYKADFSATGEEDRGDRAKGAVKVTYSFIANKLPASGEMGSKAFTKVISEGSRFTASNGLTYIATGSAEISWDGNSTSGVCNGANMNLAQPCAMSATVPVQAEEPGKDYNISSSDSVTWNNIDSGITVATASSITGGTSDIVKVVSQSDVDKAKDELVSSHTIEGKQSLFDQLKSDDLIIIESSFNAEASDVKSDPSVNEKVNDNDKPEVSAKLIFSVYTIQKSQVEEYIKAKSRLTEDRRIYSIGEPYFERFTNIEESARLKTVIKTGPTVTEESILEKVKGRKIGEVQSLLRSINGVSSVEVTPSYFWVRSVPSDDSKITIDLTVEDN